MPTYDFDCPQGHRFERFFRKISDAEFELPCPECGQTAVRRVSGGAGLIFKGSGFYITDYGKDGKKPHAPPADAAKGDKEGAGDKGETSSRASSDSAGEGASSSVPRKPGSGTKKDGE